MSKWGDLWKIIKRKAIEALRNALNRQAGKSGEITVLTVCIVAILSGLVGGVCGKGVHTRCAMQESRITVNGSSNVVTVIMATNSVDVSGSGGVSIPVTGAK